MRFVPLLPAVQGPAAFQAFQDVELELDGAPHPGWAAAAFRGLAIHALHLPARPWGDGLVVAALEALGARLEPDFLVLRASEPSGLRGTSSFFRTLEAILEQAHGRGVKVALRPEPGSAAGLAGRLKEARGEAVGFCWDASVGGDLETLSDRLLTAVHSAGADLRPLQATGYRWNMAVPGKDAADLQARIADLAARHPGVLFPSEKPTHALGRPIVPDEGVVFGSHLDRERFR